MQLQLHLIVQLQDIIRKLFGKMLKNLVVLMDGVKMEFINMLFVNMIKAILLENLPLKFLRLVVVMLNHNNLI